MYNEDFLLKKILDPSRMTKRVWKLKGFKIVLLRQAALTGLIIQTYNLGY
jgi:hypothetical protein